MMPHSPRNQNPFSLIAPISVTIVTTCMGRLDFLKQTLPNWVEATPWPIIVVDYSCPDQSGAWATELTPRVSVVYQTAEKREGNFIFSPSKARNAGAKASKSDFILFLDADNLLTPEFLPWIRRRLRSGVMCLGTTGTNRVPRLFGQIAVEKSAFEKVGGYDESFDSWGYEDISLYIWLYLEAIPYSYMPPQLVRTIPHSMELRTRFFQEKRPALSRVGNIGILSRKLLEKTGRTYEEWLKDPAFNRFLNPPSI